MAELKYDGTGVEWVQKAINHDLAQKKKKKKSTGNKEHILFRQSKVWKSFRKELIAERGAECELCGTVYKGKRTKMLQVHHIHPLAYAQLRPEWFSLLCCTCHRHIVERFKIKRSWGKYSGIWHNLLDKYIGE